MNIRELKIGDTIYDSGSARFMRVILLSVYDMMAEGIEDDDNIYEFRVDPDGVIQENIQKTEIL